MAGFLEIASAALALAMLQPSPSPVSSTTDAAVATATDDVPTIEAAREPATAAEPQPPHSVIVEQTVRADDATPTSAAAVLPAGTNVVITIDAPVTSRTATRGDMFPISLAVPVAIDGVEILPAGLTGEGQVVHAAGVGFGGRAGELIVAARYLTWGDQRIALRGMRISRAGANNTAEALAASALLTVAGLFVTGTSVDLPAGQVAAARTADDVPLPADVAARLSTAAPTPTLTPTPIEELPPATEPSEGE